MKEKGVIYGIIILLTLSVAFYLLEKTKNNTEDYCDYNNNQLCVYKIPNHIKMNCSEDIVNFFDMTYFRYNNALKQGCEVIGMSNESGYNFVINHCDWNVDFEKSQFS